MLVSELLERERWEPEDLAVALAERGVTSRAGNAVGASTVRNMLNRPAPDRWLEGLGIQVSSPGSQTDDEPADTAGLGAAARPGGEQSPRPPDGALLLPPAAGSRKRISGAYRFLGAALASGAHSEGVAVVWNDQADPIADLWLQAADENPWARRFVDALNSGGAMGDLAAGHLYLAGATLYVLGANIPAGDAVFSKYERYRPYVPAGPGPEPEQPRADQGAAHDNGAAPADTGAPGAVGDVPGPVS